MFIYTIGDIVCAVIIGAVLLVVAWYCLVDLFHRVKAWWRG